MEQTWRWFGDNDPISLKDITQAGATGIVTALHHIPVGTVWIPDEIAKRKSTIEKAGLRWSVCESIPVEDSVKRGDGGARRAIDIWKDTLANLGRAGVPVVCYNFMPVVDWVRTDLRFPMPSTALALRFDIVEFAVYDLFILRRPNSRDSYPQEIVSKAERLFEGMDDARKTLLETNIIAGLPGGADARTRQGISDLITSFDGIDATEMRRNLSAFLKEVVPVAEEFGMRLAIHPDDPPFSLFGLPRVVSTPADARAVLSAVDSEANGLTLCVGSYGSRQDNDLVAMAQEFAKRINFAHLRNVTVEDDGSFMEDDHLGGGADMIGVIDALLREERTAKAEGRRCNIPLRPDHGHLIAGDIEKKANPGYSYIGRLKGLAELRGVMRTIERQLSN